MAAENDNRHVPAGQQVGPDSDLSGQLMALWRGRWLIACSTLLLTAAGLTYAFLARPWFQASVTLSPVKQQSLPGGLGQFAGLASLAGISLPQSGSNESIATLRSREFAAEFIDDNQLLPLFFADKWDPHKKNWRVTGRKVPRIGDGIRYFQRGVLEVAEDRKTGLVTLSVNWTDAETAARWANALVDRVNERLRAIAIRESERNIEFLRGQLGSTSVVSLQESVGRVLESELQKLMMAKGSEQFAFKVIDRAMAPLEKSRPQRRLIVLVSFAAGAMLGAVLALARASWRPAVGESA